MTLLMAAPQFCGCCRALGVQVPLLRIRALDRVQHEQFENTGGRGLWSERRFQGMDPLCFRLINQTQKCTGPRLIILQSAATSDHLPWAQMPPRWLPGVGLLPGGDKIRLIVSKGTLTPAGAAGAAYSMAAAADVIDSTKLGWSSSPGGGSGGVEIHLLKRCRSSPLSDSVEESGSMGSGSGPAGDPSFRSTVTGGSGTISSQRSGAGSPLSTLSLGVLHEQLTRLMVETFTKPVEEQQAMGKQPKRSPNAQGGTGTGRARRRDGSNSCCWAARMAAIASVSRKITLLALRTCTLTRALPFTTRVPHRRTLPQASMTSPPPPPPSLTRRHR
jgi:hypothetical protein